MTPQELKNSILQLAIQGKLVEQRPEEGTAEELYRQIQQEKQRLIKEGKIKKEKPLSEITEEEKPFDIPESWKWVRVQDLFNVRSAMRIHQSDWQTSGIPFFRGRELVQLVNTGSADFEIYISRELYEQNKEKGGIPQKDDILISAVGTLGKVYIVQGTQEFYYKDAYILCLENIGKLYPKYIKRALESPYLQNEIRRDSMATTVAQLTIIKTKSLLIPLPPLAEQKRIVAKIEELLPLIDRYEKAWSRLEEFNKRFPDDMQKSILQMAIQGKLVEQRPEEGTGEELYQQIQAEKQKLIKEGKIKKEKPLLEITEEEKTFDIPDSWKWVRISSVTILNPKNNIEDEQEAAFIPMACVSDGYRNEHTFETRKWGEIKSGFTHFADNDIGIAKITPCFQNRKSVIFHNLKNGYGAGTTELSIVRTIGELLSRDYLLWFFKSEYFIVNGMKSFTGTAGQQRIHKDYLSSCCFPMPPLAEQKRIVSKLEEIFPLCEKLK